MSAEPQDNRVRDAIAFVELHALAERLGAGEFDVV
jgi:hypothetical protein